MRPIADFPQAAARDLIGLFTDIDDPMTTDGRLPAAAYATVERLDLAGLKVVPITGRPAGWCDMIERFWPVGGIVGENGAFRFSYDHGVRVMRRRFVTDAATRAENRTRLARLAERVAEVPGAAVSADQLYREADLAIDFCEDVPRLSASAVDRIVALFEEDGATAKVSSIHVNGWFGRYDKLTTARTFAAETLGCDLDRDEHRFLFCGDSPNDSAMFGSFSHACEVANVRDFTPPAITLPPFVSNACGADGFVEIVDHILKARTGRQSSERSRAWPL